jgi:hypothetical protein
MPATGLLPAPGFEMDRRAEPDDDGNGVIPQAAVGPGRTENALEIDRQ